MTGKDHARGIDQDTFGFRAAAIDADFAQGVHRWRDTNSYLRPTKYKL
jgi:hypothetical protein